MNLKGNTTKKKPTHGTGKLVKVPMKIINFNKYLFTIVDTLLVNVIPLYFAQSQAYLHCGEPSK